MVSLAKEQREVWHQHKPRVECFLIEHDSRQRTRRKSKWRNTTWQLCQNSTIAGSGSDHLGHHFQITNAQRDSKDFLVLLVREDQQSRCSYLGTRYENKLWLPQAALIHWSQHNSKVTFPPQKEAIMRIWLCLMNARLWWLVDWVEASKIGSCEFFSFP